MDENEKTDHDMILETHNDVKWIIKWIDNQDSTNLKYRLLIYSAIIMGIVGIFI